MHILMVIRDMAAESGAVLVLQMDTQECWGQGSGCADRLQLLHQQAFGFGGAGPAPAPPV